MDCGRHFVTRTGWSVVTLRSRWRGCMIKALWMPCSRSWRMRTTWSVKRWKERCPVWAGRRRTSNAKGEIVMADEGPKLIQIGKGDPAPKKDGFNLISERVVKVDLEARTMEI